MHPSTKHKKLFIPFMLAGYPDFSTSLQALQALADSGADMIEVGVPYNDPMADGPVIQQAHQMAINQGMNLSQTFLLIEQARKQQIKTPIVLFSYFNPVLQMGLEKFAQAIKKAQVDAVLLVDLPYHKDCEYHQFLIKNRIKTVLLASPTTPLERLENYQQADPYFLYYISRLGVTGVQNQLSTSLKVEMQNLRELIPNTPLCVGFGISNAQQAAQVIEYADGFIVGSLLVQALSYGKLDQMKQHAVEFARVTQEGVLTK